MYPLLFSISPFHVYSLSVAIILGWLVFSFLFWRALRESGIEEDKIFDLTFYPTLIGFIAARALFVALNWELFSETWLKIVALWVTPGLSLYGAVVGGLMTLVAMSRASRVRLGHVLDAVARSYPAAIIVGLIGVFLDGSVVGKITALPWGLRVVGHVGRRHPVQLYEIVAILIIVAIISYLSRRSQKEKWAYGVVGVWFFIMYAASMFAIEFAKDTRVYWISLSANQWILIGIFAEALGAFYVRGGGREALRPIWPKMKSWTARVREDIYAKFSKRRTS